MSLSGEEQTPAIDDTSLDKYIESVFNSNATSQPSYPSIPKIGEVVGKSEVYDKYYVPKAVSIGPYHYRNKKLESVQKLKPRYTMKLLKNNTEARRSLYRIVGEKVKELRGYYEPNSTNMYNDMDFTNIMLLDACFILFCMQSIFVGKHADCPELKINEIFFIHQDLFLLENQIPFIVLRDVMDSVSKIECSMSKIKSIIYGFILASGKPKGIKWFKSLLCILNGRSPRDESKWLTSLIEAEPDYPPLHLLDLLHNRLMDTFAVTKPSDNMSSPKNVRCNFRNVSELVEVGIHFKPCNLKSPNVKFSKGWWGFSANVALPPITVNDSTKPILLNMMAYEACNYYVDFAWVRSYVYLLDSLIDNVEDVKVLRKAWVLENSLSSDKEAADLFNEIATDLVPNNAAYLEAKNMIQIHYESWTNTLFSQLKNEYFKSPWAIFALLGALIALFLTGVQTYFAIWSPEGQCDDLCKFLKMNHHL